MFYKQYKERELKQTLKEEKLATRPRNIDRVENCVRERWVYTMFTSQQYILNKALSRSVHEAGL